MSLGLQMHVENPEAMSRFRDVLARATEADLHNKIFWPFTKWVLMFRIPTMFYYGGRVSGSDAQPAWPALSKWTLASKGTGKLGKGSALTPMTTAAMRMCKSYAIGILRTGPQSWLFEMVNTARSTSRWSPGFDYPSALHTGWGPYTVRPRADGPGFLSWPMRPGVIAAGMGRVAAGAKRTKMVVSKDRAFARETHPSGAPPRPNIKFFQIDVATLGKMTLDYVMRGIPPSEGSIAA